MARAWAISGDENRPQNMGLLVFKGWVILYTKCKDYSNNFGEGERTSSNWAKDQFLDFLAFELSWSLKHRFRDHLSETGALWPLGRVCRFTHSCVFPSNPRIFLTDLDSLELSYRAKGM